MFLDNVQINAFSLEMDTTNYFTLFTTIVFKFNNISFNCILYFNFIALLKTEMLINSIHSTLIQYTMRNPKTPFMSGLQSTMYKCTYLCGPGDLFWSVTLSPEMKVQSSG